MKKIFFILPLLFLGIFLLPHLSFAMSSTTWTYPLSGDMLQSSGTVINFSGDGGFTRFWNFYDDTGTLITGGSFGTTGGAVGGSCVNGSCTEDAATYCSIGACRIVSDVEDETAYAQLVSGIVCYSDTASGTLDCTPPAPTPSISLIGPISGSSLPNFLNWIVKFNVATSTNTLYSIRIDYGTSTAYGYSDIFPASFQGFQETAGFFDLYNTIRKGVSLTDGTWHVKATLQMVDGDTCPQWSPCAVTNVDTGDISFTIDNTLPAVTGAYFGTSTDPTVAQLYAQYAVEMTNPSNPASFFGSTGILATSTPFQTPSSTCTAPDGITDVGGGINYALCETVWALFYPSSISYATLQGSFQNLEAAPPFAYVFVPLQAMQTAGNNLASSTPQDLNYHLALGGYDNIIPSSTIIVVSPDELNNLMGTSTEGVALHQQWFQTEDYAMLLLLIAMAAIMIIKFG